MSRPKSIRSHAARYAALSRVAQVGGHAVSAPARAAFNNKFLDAVDPDRVLDPAEREKRAQAARKAHFAKLSMLSVKARQAKRDAA